MKSREGEGQKGSPFQLEEGSCGILQNLAFALKLKCWCLTAKAKEIIDDVLKVISTGSASDGKIFVYDVAEAYDIGSKETSDAAL